MAIANPTASRTADPAATRPTRTEKGISLARGPALIVGTILLAAGLYLMYKAHSFPPFANFPNGTAHRDGTFFFGIFGANGWTGMLTAVAGGLLLFGAAQHLLAKTMSLIVGVVLAAAALIAVFSSGNLVGMAAANGWTELGWGVCAVILLFNTLIPRRRRVIVAEQDGALAADRGAYAPAVGARTRGGATTREPAAAEPATTAEPAAARTTTGTTTGSSTATSTGTAARTTADGEPLVTRADDPQVRPE